MYGRYELRIDYLCLYSIAIFKNVLGFLRESLFIYLFIYFFIYLFLEAFKLRYSNPEDQIFNRVISDISAVLRETTLTISDYIETGSPVESEIVRLFSRSTVEITGEITRLIKPIFRSEYLNTTSDWLSH